MVAACSTAIAFVGGHNEAREGRVCSGFTGALIPHRLRSRTNMPPSQLSASFSASCLGVRVVAAF